MAKGLRVIADQSEIIALYHQASVVFQIEWSIRKKKGLFQFYHSRRTFEHWNASNSVHFWASQKQNKLKSLPAARLNCHLELSVVWARNTITSLEDLFGCWVPHTKPTSVMFSPISDYKFLPPRPRKLAKNANKPAHRFAARCTRK